MAEKVDRDGLRAKILKHANLRTVLDDTKHRYMVSQEIKDNYDGRGRVVHAINGSPSKAWAIQYKDRFMFYNQHGEKVAEETLRFTDD